MTVTLTREQAREIAYVLRAFGKRTPKASGGLWRWRIGRALWLLRKAGA